MVMQYELDQARCIARIAKALEERNDLLKKLIVEITILREQKEGKE